MVSRDAYRLGLLVAASTTAFLVAAVPLAAQTVSGAGATTPASPEAAPADEPSDIIVTGTRATGLRAADSAAPIQVLSEAALEHVGQTNLTAALNQVVPSYTTQAFGGDAANLTLAASLRGLNPNQTLVLVNGKRRHGTANIQVQASPFQGSAAPDLDLIPTSAIARVEILQDGAAAQYGSDAIAGVINIILKSDRSGLDASATAGSLYQGGGQQLAQTAHLGMPLGAKGHVDVSVLHRFQDFSVRNGGDNRVSAPDGTLLSGVPASWANLPGFPDRLNKKGQPRGFLTSALVDASYDVGAVTLYGFGTYSRRMAQSRATYRLPNRVTRTSNGTTTVFAPNGFLPALAFEEDDYAITGGAKGDVAGFQWDLSATYGRDRVALSTVDSANASLYVDTGATPTSFYDGTLDASQLTVNLDVKHEFAAGLAEPVTVAAGGEFRRDAYAIEQGDAASIYKEGGQGYPGFRPSDATSRDRRAWSGYLDVLVKPVTDLTVDLAGRVEHYSDFGSKAIGKLTARYDISPAFAVRGTVSTGFRAPTLAESFYSATTVSPTTATVFLPANSPEARLIGFQSLKPETSTNLSAGVVLRPVDRLTVTIDAYQIRINDRIAATGTILGKSGTTVVNQSVLNAIAARGNVLDPTVTFAGVSLFTNGIDTRSRGVDVAVAYPTTLPFGRIDWSLTGNVNRTRITNNKLGSTLFNPIAVSFIETASPRYKVGLGGLLTAGAVSFNLRETLYGKSSGLASPSGAAPFYRQVIGAAFITDLEATIRPVEHLRLSIGANNLFNKRPRTVEPVPGSATTATRGPTLENGNVIYGAPLNFGPYGAYGGYYYGRLSIDL